MHVHGPLLGVLDELKILLRLFLRGNFLALQGNLQHVLEAELLVIHVITPYQRDDAFDSLLVHPRPPVLRVRFAGAHHLSRPHHGVIPHRFAVLGMLSG